MPASADCPAADFGGVSGPIAAAGALPGDGDADVDAEHAGEDRGGQVGGEFGIGRWIEMAWIGCRVGGVVRSCGRC
jgi:hypothetical protein